MSMDAVRRRALLGSGELEACTPQTITDFAMLDDDLNVSAERGYVISRSEHRVDVTNVAANIKNWSGGVIRCLIATSHARGYNDDTVAEVGAELKRATEPGAQPRSCWPVLLPIIQSSSQEGRTALNSVIVIRDRSNTVNVEWRLRLTEGATQEAKTAMLFEFNEAAHRALDTPREGIRIILGEIPAANYAQSGAVFSGTMRPS